MLLVKTKIAPSPISGIGLFADEFIPKGTILWKFVPGFDLKFSKEEVENMPDEARDFIHTYSYLSHVSGQYILCIDNARFYNHSDTPNTDGIEIPGTDGENGDVAIRDILVGEEITYDYIKWDGNYKKHLFL